MKIEAVVSPEVADRILARLAQRHFEHYAVTAFVETVKVVRGEKYTQDMEEDVDDVAPTCQATD